MTIRQNIQKVIEDLQKDREQNPPDGGQFSKDFKEAAISAVLGGSEDYLAYMRRFGNTPGEIARLIPTDGTHNDSVKREARAYLVSNGVCAPGTATGLLNEVLDKLDTPPVVG